MTNITNINLADIKVDASAQMRAGGTDPGVVAEYAEAMEGGATFPPIVVFHDGNNYWIGDGFHRLDAAQRISRETIQAEVLDGCLRDAVLLAAGANANHGLRRTAADKRRAIEALLHDPEWSRWSDRQIAKACRVDHKTVGKVRRELTGEIPSERIYRDRHGNESTMQVRTAANGKASTVVGRLLERVPTDKLIEECQRRGLEVSDA